MKTVLVLGTGFAGQGHAEAFRAAGAQIVGIVGRTDSVVQEVAHKLNIPFAGTHWADALNLCKPDIVAIGTPGGAHFEPVIEALEAGCHVFCDKPLAVNGEQAKAMYEKSLQMGVKTAFASCYRYMPEILHAKKLIADGVIGEPREVECISHFNLDPHIPFGWSHRLDQGGGRLNNNFTHLLSMTTYVLGENIVAMAGEVRNDMPLAPIVEGVHNFTQRRNFIPDDIDDPKLQWAECDAEWSYTVLAKIESAYYPAVKPVSVLFKHGGIVPRFHDDHIVFYGSKGAIYIKGHYGSGPLHLSLKQGEWIEQATPQSIKDSLPDIKDDTQRNWTILATKFVQDINGEPFEPYQTFKEGSRYQQLIELIQTQDAFTDVSKIGG